MQFNYTNLKDGGKAFHVDEQEQALNMPENTRDTTLCSSPQASSVQESTSLDELQVMKVYDVLAKAAMDLASFPEQAPLIPRSIQGLRRQAADLARTLAFLRSDYDRRAGWDLNNPEPATESPDLEMFAAQLRENLVQIRSLLSDAATFSGELDVAAQEYARHSDNHGEELENMLECLEEEVRAFENDSKARQERSEAVGVPSDGIAT